MKTYFLDRYKFYDFLLSLSRKYEIFLPEFKEPEYRYVRFIKDYNDFSFNKYRCIEPPKTFLTHAKEKLFSYFPQESPAQEKPQAIIGFKNCDLTSLRIQDYVFKEGIETDELYKQRRDNTLIISSDCSGFKQTCFCLSLDITPYPTFGFDLNMSEVEGGLLFEVGSISGEAVIKENTNLFSSMVEEAKPLLEKQNRRRKLVNDLNAMIIQQDIMPKGSLQEIVNKGYNSEVWKEESIRCVECGACNMICGTCHCFLLAEQKEGTENIREKIWDSCQYANFSKVAGGANPLISRPMRLRNRFLKKFDFFPQNLNMYACTGCGRCIEACPAQIDIRKVLKMLST
jgi:ferredoxin